MPMPDPRLLAGQQIPLPMPPSGEFTPDFDPNTVTLMTARTGEVPIDIREAIETEIKHGSAFMQLARAIPITAPETQFTHMSGVGAYWVDEAQRIETSKPTWLKVIMRTKKMAVIIPTTKENLRYSITNFFELMRPEIAEAFAKKFDSAAIAGINTPFAWSILKSAQFEREWLGEKRNAVITETDNKYNDLNLAMAAVEAGDFDPNGVASLREQRYKYRATKDDSGRPIFNEATAGVPATLLGLPTAFLHNKAFAGSEIVEVVGDFNEVVYGILRGIEYEILDQATLTTIEASDAPGVPVNLAERDMVALKATMEVGMMVLEDEAFAVVTKTPMTP